MVGRQSPHIGAHQRGASALFALWWTVFFQLPLGYRWLTSWSFPYTHFITQTMSVRLSLGPSASAVDLLLLGITGVVGITLAARPRRWTYAAAALVLLEAGRILYLWMAPTLQTVVGEAIPVSLTPHLDMPAVYFLFVAMVLILLRRAAPSPPRDPVPNAKPWRSRWAPARVTPTSRPPGHRSTTRPHRVWC
jgi:hypothetical protein